MGNKDKDKEHGKLGTDANATHDAHQASPDLSCERAITLDRMVAEAIARETAWITVTFTAILNERTPVNIPTSLK